MKNSTMWWILAISLFLPFILPAKTTTAQTDDGTIIVNACYDQNADGDCTDSIDGPPPADTEACLNDDSNCQPVPVTFSNLSAGSYTAFLRFPGTSQGHYPTTPQPTINLASGETAEVTLGAVYPYHPKDIAVHPQINKLYVSFQGPTINGQRPYPFVAVIDGDTDQVLQTIPGGANGIAPDSGPGVGRDIWGVEVSANGQFVYVGSFVDGLISIIDPFSDTVLTNFSPGPPFKPTAPAVDPVTGRIHFTDYEGGRMLVLNDNASTPANPIVSLVPVADFPAAFSPFEITVADTDFDGYNYITLRDSLTPNPYKFVGLRSSPPYNITYHNLTLPGGGSGMPHAIDVWQEAGRSESRLFMTYAADPRPGGQTFPNPNRVAMYGFSPADPGTVSPRTTNISVGNYAEVGLIYNRDANHMLGTYAGFAYFEDAGHVAACANPTRGGNYALTFNGDRLGVADGGATPEVWQYPTAVVGNPPLESTDLLWRNPFELVFNPHNGKVYVTDRCWNEFPGGGQPGGGAVLTFRDPRTPEIPSETNPALTVTKSDNRDPVVAGFELIYTIRVENTGDVNLNASIVDHLPPGVTPNGPTTWDNVFIPFGGVWEGTLSVTVNPGTEGILTNRVEVSTQEGAYGEAFEDTLAVISAVQISKSDSVDPVPAGDVLIYTIQVQNVGTLDLHGTIIDSMPPEVTPLGPTSWQNVLLPADGTLVFTLPVQVDPQAVGPLLNTVAVTTEEGPSANAQETTLVANLTVTKSADPAPVLAGDPLTYTIRVNNTGSADLHATITDILPPEVIPSDPVIWGGVFISAGGVWEQTLVVTVDPNTFTPITNTVTVTTQEGVSGRAEITTPVISLGVIRVRACFDQNADGICALQDTPPPDILGCLRDNTEQEWGCKPVEPDGAIFTNLDPARTYTPYLQFPGRSQGYYPTSRPEPIPIEQGVETEVLLGTVYPVHPKGVAVHQGQNKVYVAVQGPLINNDHPFPFVAVIDGDSNEVLYTIPGGDDGIGRGVWGVMANENYVYVGAFDDGRISVIDPATDLVVANRSPMGSFQPTAPALNPVTGQVHFPDYRGGRTITLAGTNIVDGAYVQHGARGYSPFEMVIAAAGSKGTSYITLRDALLPFPFTFTALNNANRNRQAVPVNVGNGRSGNPHAIGLWQQPGDSEGRLFITYADDPRRDLVSFPNPNKLALYKFSTANPQSVGVERVGIDIGDYAEVGLTFDPTGNQMLGTYAGFPYDESNGVAAACATGERGGTYAVNFNGDVSPGFAPGIVVGNPPLTSANGGLDWQNPFEIAINPNNGTVYVTDRCWNEFPGGGTNPANRGAMLILNRADVGTVNVQRSTVPTPNIADVNADGIINIIDLTFIAARYGTTNPAADLNKDGIVNILDVSIAARGFGQ